MFGLIQFRFFATKLIKCVGDFTTNNELITKIFNFQMNRNIECSAKEHIGENIDTEIKVF